MTELLGIIGVAALFAAFGLLRPRIRESHGCDGCPSHEDTTACGTCPGVGGPSGPGPLES
jgi:hypothetical protein